MVGECVCVFYGVVGFHLRMLASLWNMLICEFCDRIREYNREWGNPAARDSEFYVRSDAKCFSMSGKLPGYLEGSLQDF